MATSKGNDEAIDRRSGARGAADLSDEHPPTVEDLVTRHSPDELSMDDVFGILSNRRRRLILSYLRRGEETVSIGELSEAIAAVENDRPIESVSSAERKRVYVALHQCHLPKMDEVDVISFAKSRGTVERASNTEVLQEYLERIRGGFDVSTSVQSWQQFNFAIVATTFLALLVTLLLTAGFSTLHGVGLAILGAIGLGSLVALGYQSNSEPFDFLTP